MFTRACRLSAFFCSTNLCWSHETNRLQMLDDSKSLKRSTQRYQIFLILMMAGGLYKIFESPNNTLGIVDKIFFAVVLVTLLGLYLFITALKGNEVAVCTYVNGLLEFRSRFSISQPENQTFAKDSIVICVNTCFAYMLCIDSVIVPAFSVYALHYVDPCKPSLTGYFVLPGCYNQASHSKQFKFIRVMFDHVSKLLLLVTNHWFWTFGNSIVGISVAGLLVLCTITLGKHLQW